jgi:dCMP deaminase
MQLICNAAKEGGALEGCDIYSTLQPCYECTKNLSIVKPRAIFYVHEYDKFNKKDVLNMLKFQNIIYSKI